MYLGRVDPDEGPAVASDYAAGLLSLDHYLGRLCYPALVQAAELYVRRPGGIREIDRLTLGALDPLCDDRADVHLRRYLAVAGSGGPRLARPDETAALVTGPCLRCRAEGLARPWEYQARGAH